MIPKEHSERAACTKSDPEMFFSTNPYHVRAAKNICYGCPIIGRCLADAMINEQRLDADERYGIWGGHTPGERVSYQAEWKRIHAKNLPLLKEIYKNHTMHGKYAKRLTRCIEARRKIAPALPRYDDYRQVLDLVIANPEMSTEKIALRINRSEAWVSNTISEAWARTA